MTTQDINDIINAICPNDEDYEKPCISPKYLRQELEQLALDQKQWNGEPTTKNDLAVDCIVDVLGSYTDLDIPYKREIAENIITKLSSVTPQEPIEKCKWIKYDYRTMCPKEHIDVDNPYWRIPETRMDALKYCPYCGKEIEVEK